MSARSRIAGVIGFIAIALLRAYQVAISPLNPWHCKFHPSCSNYAVEAVRLHGPWRGSWLAVGRLLRCRPGTFGGIDPVPEPEELSSAAVPVAEARHGGQATGLDKAGNTPLSSARRHVMGAPPADNRIRRCEPAGPYRRYEDSTMRSGDNPGPRAAGATGLSSNSTGGRTA